MSKPLWDFRQKLCGTVVLTTFYVSRETFRGYFSKNFINLGWDFEDKFPVWLSTFHVTCSEENFKRFFLQNFRTFIIFSKLERKNFDSVINNILSSEEYILRKKFLNKKNFERCGFSENFRSLTGKILAMLLKLHCKCKVECFQKQLTILSVFSDF